MRERGEGQERKKRAEKEGEDSEERRTGEFPHVMLLLTQKKISRYLEGPLHDLYKTIRYDTSNLRVMDEKFVCCCFFPYVSVSVSVSSLFVVLFFSFLFSRCPFCFYSLFHLVSLSSLLCTLPRAIVADVDSLGRMVRDYVGKRELGVTSEILTQVEEEAKTGDLRFIMYVWCGVLICHPFAFSFRFVFVSNPIALCIYFSSFL